MSIHDTIFALATPSIKSSVAIIRISGSKSLYAARQLSGKSDFIPRVATFCSFYHTNTKEVIDRGLVLYFAAPHSFTGEDVVELQIHGSMAVAREIIALLGNMLGMRHAEAGEFSKRAFFNGKMDLTEIEAIADLINAETSAQHIQAIHQMRGGLSAYYTDLREKIIYSLAQLEAYIDFPDEDIPDDILHHIACSLNELIQKIELQLADNHKGERIRSGINIVIIGLPNAGKSSLLNAIAKRDVAITSHRAGTTRDLIEVHLDIAGFPVIMVDTAGLRETDDSIEQEGINRAIARANSADIKLILLDASVKLSLQKDVLAHQDENSLLVINKNDISTLSKNEQDKFIGSYTISMLNGEGLDMLLDGIKIYIVNSFSGINNGVITQERHRNLLNNALIHLKRFFLNIPLELKCEELRQAGMAVGKITGKIYVDEVLEVIFKKFCIGK